MVPLVAAMGVADFLDKRKAAEAQRKAAAADILQSNASKLGAPTYNVQAAKFKDRGRPGALGFAAGLMTGEADASPSNTGKMLQMLAEGGGGRTKEELDPLAQDYRNNPEVPTYGGGGSSMARSSADPYANPFDDYAMSKENDELTGFAGDEDEALRSIGIY
jgi:hypothetical protein